MGQDTASVTLIGVKISLDRLLKEGNNSPYFTFCNCGYDTLYCEECSGDTITLGNNEQYTVYQEHCNDYTDEKNVFICIAMYRKNGPRGFDPTENVKCPLKLEFLINKREHFATLLIGEKLMTNTEFHDSFGIYTLIEASY